MTLHRVAPALALIGLLSPIPALAQDTPAPPPVTPSAPGSDLSAADRALISDPYRPVYAPYSSGHQYRSRTAAHPHYANPDDSYGFRNPGGVGRMNEFYPPGNQFPNQGRNPVVAAQFGTGSPDLSRSSQMQAQSIGIQRTNSLNQQIDALARPLGGYGFGFGFGGFPY